MRDSNGQVMPFAVGVEARRVWWGQPTGALRVEIGLCDEGVYLQEGDMKLFGRRSVLSTADGTIKFSSIEGNLLQLKQMIRERLANWILNKCRNVTLN